ncbi:hypothetical protein SRCM101060_01237 [Lactiplantibacillus plantarum]|nr:hypothetical protein SRCM101060_01237 [Lactiplantibacillus plantarum]
MILWLGIITVPLFFVCLYFRQSQLDESTLPTSHDAWPYSLTLRQVLLASPMRVPGMERSNQ